MISEELQDFINDNDDVASHLAEDIANINKDFEDGIYPAVVRDELLEDAYEVAQAKMEADDLDTKIKLEKLYDIIKSIASGMI